MLICTYAMYMGMHKKMSCVAMIGSVVSMCSHLCTCTCHSKLISMSCIPAADVRQCSRLRLGRLCTARHKPLPYTYVCVTLTLSRSLLLPHSLLLARTRAQSLSRKRGGGERGKEGVRGKGTSHVSHVLQIHTYVYTSEV